MKQRNKLQKAVDVYLADTGRTRPELAKDLHMGKSALGYKLKDPGKFTVSELRELCTIVGIKSDEAILSEVNA